MRAAVGLLAILALGPAGPSAAEEPKPPASAPEDAAPASEILTEHLHGIRFEIRVPKPLPEGGSSLLLYFHDYVGNGKLAVESLGDFCGRGFVVAAPWSTSGRWEPKEIDAARTAARDLCERYLVPRERRHAAGLQFGGQGAAAVGFDEELGFATATWICGSWSGGSVPKETKTRLATLFLWGPKEGPSRIARYRDSAALITEKVKSCVVRGAKQEPGLGRARGEDPTIPSEMIPAWLDFLCAREGRFAPGKTDAFEWQESLDAARQEMVATKAGGFAYIHGLKPAGDEEARTKALQNEVFYDRLVRHFADQLVAVKIEKSAAKELLDAAKVTETPAIVVFKRGGREVLKAVSGEVNAKSLIPLLRAVAADQEMPR
ncbi:MAG TPA: hypothetical protein VFS92_06875 [Planctomycetota bacterium]|nr:hypothetical protein [Planctomycetota bacterium]